MTHAHDALGALALAVCLVVAGAAAPVGGLAIPADPAGDGAVEAPADAAGQASAPTAGGTMARLAGSRSPGTPDGTDDDGDGTNWTLDTGATDERSGATAGEMFASAVAAQDTELEGEVRARAFDRRLAAAGNGTARARVLGGTLADVRLRLRVLETRRTELRAAYRNGTISRGRYRVELARLTTEARSLQRVLDRADGATAELSPEVRAEYGLGNETVASLRARADAVGDRNGTALGEIDLEPDARFEDSTVERPDWNRTLVDGDTLNGTDWTDDGTDRTVEEFDNTTGNRTEDRYTERRMTLLTLEGNVTELEGVHDHLADRSDSDRDVEEALACARDALDAASADISAARTALEADEPARADDRIADARSALTRARDCLEQARAALEDGDDSTRTRTSTPTDWRKSG